jgi:hypothetical protein
LIHLNVKCPELKVLVYSDLLILIYRLKDWCGHSSQMVIHHIHNQEGIARGPWAMHYTHTVHGCSTVMCVSSKYLLDQRWEVWWHKTQHNCLHTSAIGTCVHASLHWATVWRLDLSDFVFMKWASVYYSLVKKTA